MALYSTFFESILAELSPLLSRILSTDVSKAIALDLEYVLNRAYSEGYTFLVTKLSQLGKAFETSAVTCKPLEIPMGFNILGKSRLPSLFNSIIKIGWTMDGRPRFTEDYQKFGKELAFCMQALRQLTLAFSKVSDVDCIQSIEESEKSFEERISRDFNLSVSSKVLNKSRKLLSSIFLEEERLKPELAQWESIPFGRHGPGAVANRESGREKWNFQHVPGIDDQIYFWNSVPDLDESTRNRVARLAVVPKDYKSNRCICIEPKELQFAQQGLMQILFSLISNHPLASSEIDFHNQIPSQLLCRNLDMCTIDLKDASDTVSLQLARLLLPREVFRLLTKYRSNLIELGDGTVVRSKIFATMGSAICFPIETLIFWAIARSVGELKGVSTFHIRVFGDDVIVPQWIYGDVIEVFESCGFIINPSKTCAWPSLVRESCGAWMVNGNECNVVKFSVTDPKTASDYLSLWNQANNLGLYWHGLLDGTKNCLRQFCKTCVSPSGKFGDTRWSKQLQRIERWMPVLSRRRGCSSLPGYSSLYAWIVGNDTRPCSSGIQKVQWNWSGD